MSEHEKADSRIFVAVCASFGKDGMLMPESIEWEDGRCFLIQSVTDIRHASACFSGKYALRYTVWIMGKPRLLYFEAAANCLGNRIGRWFVEKKPA